MRSSLAYFLRFTPGSYVLDAVEKTADRIGGRVLYLWRAVDTAREVLDVLLQTKREQSCSAEIDAEAGARHRVRR